ncbi:hypothetical protein cypCar_00042441, partial [Cyprinus carpio]
ILTQEDWNKVLYNGMASTSPVAALYFIALMTFGNYVLFNLLVAILVEGFQTEAESENAARRNKITANLFAFFLTLHSLAEKGHVGVRIVKSNPDTSSTVLISEHAGDASKSDSEVDFYARSLEDVSGRKKDLSTSSVVPINGHVDLKSSLTPPLITHTAATPMPIPKISGGGDPALDYESRRGSNVSMDPNNGQDKSPSSARSSPNAPWSSASSWNSRRSSWNSLGRAPSLKRQKRQSGERRSLLSGDGQSSSDEGDVGESGGGGGLSEGDDASLARTDSLGQRPRHRRMESLETRSSFDLPPDTLQVPYMHRSASIHSARPPNFLSNGKSSPSAATTQLSLDEHHSEDDNADDEGNLSRKARLYRWLEHKQPQWCRERVTWSLYLFPPQSRFRVTCNKIISHKMFDHVVLVIIFLNCITIAMERPRIDPSSAVSNVTSYTYTHASMPFKTTFAVGIIGRCSVDRKVGERDQDGFKH